MYRSCLLALAALAGCQDKSSEAPKPVPKTPVADVQVLDGKGALVADLKQTRPCRATIGPQELIVGGPPLVSTFGSTTWSGVSDVNGTTLTRNDERIARVFPVGDPASGAVFDLHGIAQTRVTVTGQIATVENGASATVRRLTLAGGKITSDNPALTITGTEDLILAALLSAPELLPEVRMLAACERVLLKKDPT